MDRVTNSIINMYKKNLHISEDQEAILRYSLDILSYTIIAFILALLISWPLQNSGYVLSIIITAGLLRTFSGGAHFSNKRNCITNTVLIVTLLGLLSKNLLLSHGGVFGFALGVFLFALWCINKYAPADTVQKPINNGKQKTKLKGTSFIIVSIWFSIALFCFNVRIFEDLVFSTALAIMWQCFTLTKTGYHVYHFIDSILNYRKRGEKDEKNV